MRQRALTTALLAFVALTAALGPVEAQRPRALTIYVVDVEGGNAQLYVAPSGESLLIDTGNAGTAAVRDAERILAAAKDAGVTRIDHLISTHFHGDHVGGVAEVASRLPIAEFIDHGPNVQPGPQIDGVMQQYAALAAKATHRVVRPGDRIPLPGVDWRIVTSGAATLRAPLPGAGGANPYCAGFRRHEVNPVSGQPVGNTEDEQSVGSHITFGRFRLLYVADLPWNQEFDLMCPANRIGDVDVFIASRHGQFSSNSEALVHAVRPRVTIVNNGIRKGGQPESMKVLFTAPRLQDVWQVHASELSGQEHTVPGVFIANLLDTPLSSMPLAPMIPPARGAQALPVPPHDGPAYWIKIEAQADGSFAVMNGRNGFGKRYPADRN
jgi:beta-lactamase superfamily II metal-dependent hydrolase